jgi:arylsulfatase
LQPRIAPNLAGRAYTITADVDVPASGADGVIIAQGSRYGGITLFVKDHRVVYEVNAFGYRSGQLVATEPLQPGRAHIVLSLTPSETGNSDAVPSASRRPLAAKGTLSINGKAQGEAEFTNVNLSFSETLDIGSDLGSPVSPDYRSPNRFSGKIDTVKIELLN